MGLFKKKSDPLSERAQALAAEIAALEAQIQQLSAQGQKPGNTPSEPAPPVPAPSPAQPHTAPAATQPKLRSTALPHHRQAAPARPLPPVAAREAVFEDLVQNRLHSESEPQPAEPANELDVRKNGLGSVWRRFTTHFRGPPTSNPKLVNYLAAGSIQGLRPLRYERRVARNRTIVLILVLVLALWWVIWMFWKGRH